MSRMGGKRPNGWYEMERQYRHNRVPQIIPPTQWQKMLSAIHLREEDALLAARMPNTRAARLLREELTRTGMYHRHYVPETVLEAFGWTKEVEERVAGDWTKGGRPRKEKAAKANMPLLDGVKG